MKKPQNKAKDKKSEVRNFFSRINPFKPNKDLKEPQLDMNLKFSNFAFFNKIIYRLKKSTAFLDQFNFWRSPVLWLQIFVITFTTIYGAIFIYQKRTLLPDEIPLFFFQQETTARFINIDAVLILMAGNILLQIISIFISSRVFFKFKFLSHFVLLNSIVSNIVFNLALFKVLRLTLY